MLWCKVLGFEERRKEVANLTIEKRMLHIICGKTLRDGICNQTSRDMTGVKNEFMVEQRLVWFGPVENIDNEKAPVKSKNFVVDYSKKIRPKKYGEKLSKRICWLEV